MLYIFHVDTGTMLTFDMSLALESVNHLKRYLEKAWKIPCDKQVLLVSGGECLDPDARVCAYSAGTDTNPIFLFSKSVIESTTPPCASVDYGSDFDFKEKIREASDLPADYATVVHRTQLSQQLYEVAREQTKICERLVHDQHLQQQGWAAVVANLEDITTEFMNRSGMFEKNFCDYLGRHISYRKFLQSFNNDLQILSKIPLLPTLLDSEKKYLEANKLKNGNASGGAEYSDVVSDTKKPQTLLEWISAADNKNSMDQLFDLCSKGLDQFDQKAFDATHVEINRALLAADKPEMKEVKGLGDRLFGLEQLMVEAKKYVQEQGDLAQSFLQNQTRAGNIGDKSILPDLCASHRKQLVVMLHNHQQLCDIRRRCTKAKEELSVNLYHRLKWVMYVENTILETSHKLYIYHENLKRLRKHLEVLQQIHLAPSTYLTAVTEVVRRRKFSQAFLLWASELACHSLTIHNDEVTKRKEFHSQFEGHFLNSLFPGMDDLPPSFATQAPSIFDSTLPKLSNEDIDRLKDELPDLSENLIVPDISAILNFFVVKSETKTELDKVDDRGVEEKLVQVVNDVGLASNLDQNLLKTADSETCLLAPGLPHLKDLDRGCESETDTEEFEKVCQSPLELHFDKDIPSPRPGTQDASTLTEDNLQTSRSEQDKLKSILLKMAQVSNQAILNLRTELTELKASYMAEESSLKQTCQSLSNSWEQLSIERDFKEREIINRLTLDHELQLGDYRKVTEARSQEIKCLRDENACLETRVKNIIDENTELKNEIDKIISERDSEVSHLRKNLHDMEQENKRIVKELKENLSREHKAELDSIRSRFKLMTMERSPSETNLEKIDQIREDYEKQKKDCIEKALVEERERLDKILQDVVGKLKGDYEQAKDKLINECRNKDRHIQTLLREINLLKGRENENECTVTTKNVDDMGASVSIIEGKIDAATSPMKHRDKLTKSQTSLVKSGKLSIDSCSVGDVVLVVWDQSHETYMILQDSNIMYFLHTDCLEGLGLKKGDGEKQISYCVGQVIDKEYCHAKRANNRYKVPEGTKFYRITVKPVILNETTKHTALVSRVQPLHISESQVAAGVTETILTEESGPFSTPITPTRSRSNMESSVVTQEETSQNVTSTSTDDSNRSPSAVHLYSSSTIRYNYIYDGVCDLLKIIILYLYLFEEH